MRYFSVTVLNSVLITSVEFESKKFSQAAQRCNVLDATTTSAGFVSTMLRDRNTTKRDLSAWKKRALFSLRSLLKN